MFKETITSAKKVESPNSETSNKLELYFYPILPLSTKNKISRYFIAPIDYLFYNNGQDVSLEKNFKERYNKLKSILGEGIDNIKKLDSRYNTKVSQTFNGEKNLKMIKDNLINLENKNIYEMIIDIYSQIFTKVYANDKKNDINKIINNLTQACNEKKIKPEDLTITTDINHFKRAAILFIALIQAYFFNTDNEKEQLIYPTLRNDVTYWHSLEVNNYLGVMEQYPYASLQRFLALKQLANEGNLLARMDVGSGYNYGTLLNDGPATLPLDNNDFISKQYLEFDWDNFIPGQLLLKKINGTLNSLRTSRVLIVDLVAYCQKYVDIVFASENYDQFKDKINNQEFIDLLIHLSYNSLSDYHIKYCWYLLTYQSYVNHQRIPYYIKRYFDENKDKLIEIFPAEIAIISKFYHQKQITMDNLIENMNLEIDFNIIRKLCGELKMIPSNILYYVGRLRKDRSFIEMGITKKDPNCINYGLSFNTASVYNPNDSLKNKVLILIEKNNPDNIAELRSKKIDILKLLIELQEQINSYNEKISEAYLNSNYDLAQDEVSKQNEYKELFNKLMDVLQSV